MKLLRLRLRNVAGVTASEVSFAESGVTFVQGPNEIGKTSHVRALDVLLDELDSSKKQRVLDLRPVGKDVASDIELEAELGGVHFVYRKRFHRDRMTELSISAPAIERLQGREAHERVQQLMREHMDVALWKAIRVDQGDGTKLPDLTSQSALSEALDRVAGGARASDQEESLYARVEREFAQFFTLKQRQPTGEYRDVLAEAAAAEEAASHLRAERDSLERDVRDAERLAVTADGLAKQVRETEAARAAAELRASALQLKLKDVDAAEALLLPVRMQREAAERALADRRRLADELSAAINSAARAVAQRDELLPLATRASDELRAAEDAYATQKVSVEAAILLERVRRSDAAFRNNEIELARNRERMARVVAVSEKGVAARSELDANRMTDALLERIRKAEQAVLSAEEVVRTASPKLRVHALEDANVDLSGRRLSLHVGDEHVEPVVDDVALTIDGRVKVIVSPGASATELRARLEQARAERQDAFLEGGVASLEEAVARHARRVEAERVMEDLKRVVRDDLRDWTQPQLARSIANLERSTLAHVNERPAAPAMAADVRESRALHEEAESMLQSARDTLERLDRERDLARVRSGEISKRLAELETDVRVATERRVRVEALMNEAGVDEPVDDIAKRTAFLREEEKRLVRALDVARARLGGESEEAMTSFLQDAYETERRVRKEHDDARIALARATSILETKNERGIGESLLLAESRLHHAQQKRERTTRHAEAARLLYDTLTQARERARREYIAPLQERVNVLGRLVFDDSFSAEVDDELRVVSVTRNAERVAFASLSQGAREQLALLVRLAAGMLVAKGAGVPLLFDDVLGASDVMRLTQMAPAIRLAGKDCQIIVLTCMPERFTHVPGKRVTLDGTHALTPSATSE